MSSSLVFTSESAKRTSNFGLILGRSLQRGQVVALKGELGAGKTTLIKAICKGAGIPDDVIVCSPSYTLINEYEGEIPVYHFDLYRLEGAKDIHELGYDEYLEGDGLSLIEWADIAPEILPSEHLAIKIEITGQNEREITLTARGGAYEKCLSKMESWKDKSGK